MKSKEEAVVLTLAGLAQHYRKPYCMPSQEKIVELVWKFQQVRMSLRSLNRYLRSLEDSGFIKRVRRPIKFLKGECRFKSTLYKFCGKFFNHFIFLTRKCTLFWRFWEPPMWVKKRAAEQGQRIAPPIDRVPKMAEYNPLRGVSLGGLRAVKDVLRNVRPKKGSASPV